MKKLFLVLVVLLLPVGAFAQTPTRDAPATTTQKAQLDAYIKIPDIEGEATRVPGVEPDEIDLKATDDSGTQKGGNVEFEWKVEEGESAPPRGVGDIKSGTTTPQPLTPDFSILLGGGSGEATPGSAVAEENRAEIAQIILEGMQEQGAPTESVSLNYEKIKMTTKQMVKFLGFIPLTVSANVEIDREGKVEVKFPWWAFLASGRNEEELGTKVITTLSNVLKVKQSAIKNAQQ